MNSKITTLLFSFFWIATCCAQNFTKEDFQEIGSRLKKAGVKTIQNSISGKYDNHNDTYTMSSVNVPVGNSSIYFSYNVIKVDDSLMRTPVKIHVVYRANNWLWLESISATLALTKDTDSSAIERSKTYLSEPVMDVLSDATIKERSQGTLNSESLEFYRQIIESGRSISVRINGESKYSERTVLGLTFKSKTKNFFNSLDQFEEYKN